VHGETIPGNEEGRNDNHEVTAAVLNSGPCDAAVLNEIPILADRVADVRPFVRYRRQRRGQNGGIK
jgi:hypothetical protein